MAKLRGEEVLSKDFWQKWDPFHIKMLCCVCRDYPLPFILPPCSVGLTTVAVATPQQAERGGRSSGQRDWHQPKGGVTGDLERSKCTGRAAKLRSEKRLERTYLESQVNSLGFIWEDKGCHEGAPGTGKTCLMKIPLVVSVEDDCQEG